jgi:hypothetical protein
VSRKPAVISEEPPGGPGRSTPGGGENPSRTPELGKNFIDNGEDKAQRRASSSVLRGTYAYCSCAVTANGGADDTGNHVSALTTPTRAGPPGSITLFGKTPTPHPRLTPPRREGHLPVFPFSFSCDGPRKVPLWDPHGVLYHRPSEEQETWLNQRNRDRDWVLSLRGACVSGEVMV